MKILVMNGVNLTLTGKREKSVYGTATLDEINEKIAMFCKENGDNGILALEVSVGSRPNGKGELFHQIRSFVRLQNLSCRKERKAKCKKGGNEC